MVLTSRPRGIFSQRTLGRRLRLTAASPARPPAEPPTITPSAPFEILPAPLPALPAPDPPLRCCALLGLEERLRSALDARGRLAAAWDPDRVRAELEAAGLLRADGAFDLLRVEPAFEGLRAAEVDVLLRWPAFGEAVCFELVCLATALGLYGRGEEEHVHATSFAAAAPRSECVP